MRSSAPCRLVGSRCGRAISVRLRRVVAVDARPFDESVRGRLVVTPMRWRVPLAALVGAGVYWVFLRLSYGLLRGYYIPPQWWHNHMLARSVTSATWLTLINAAGAILAAAPASVGIVLFARANRFVLGIAVGVLASLSITVSGLLEYGVPRYASAWFVDALQFLSIGLAVLVEVVLFSSRPLTTRSSGVQ